ncbi:MAG: N-acetyltransferase [Chitinispirillaceae bacterium]|jgi:hypothetical protein|nr:N-acetyltransferase [Chitinispirillaceae bacterium]
MNDVTINHDQAGCRFHCTVDGLESALEYEMKEPEILDVFRTFVDPVLRGRGIAERLMVSACEFAREKKMRVWPSCSYAVLFYKRHEEWLSIVAPGADLANGGSCRLPETKKKEAS